MKRLVFLIFVAAFSLGVISGLVSVTQKVFAQGTDGQTNDPDAIICVRNPNNPNALICPGGGTVSRSREPGLAQSNDGDSLSWIFFNALWMAAVVFLYLILRKNRDNKVLVEAPNKTEKEKEEKKPEELFKKWEKRTISFLLTFLSSTFLSLLVSGDWWLLLLFLVSTSSAIFTNWKNFTEYTKAIRAAMGFSRTALITEEKTTFKDVGGLHEVITELEEVVALYRNPKEAEAWNIRLPSGILLVGEPGCGKTLLARAIAGEANLKFFAYSAAEIGSSYVRSGAQELKYMFASAQSSAPCVLFIDELDSLGRKRGYDSSGEFDHALTELLHEMDGIKRKSGVLVLAATNREDILDDALLRPGRFDKKIIIPRPDVDGREHIMKIHMAKKMLAPGVNLREIAARTAGFSGAALEQLTNEASQLAKRRYDEEKKSRENSKAAKDADKTKGQENIITLVNIAEGPERLITLTEIDEAIRRVQAGPARKLILSEAERRTVAQHEIGHAIVTAKKGLEVLDRVTLMARNWALGMTEVHDEERQLPTKPFLVAKITSLLGGRAAEEVFLGKDNVTGGAANDMEKAHEIGRRMVCEWGMGELGPAVFHKLGGLPGQQNISEHTAMRIDQEVEKLMTSCLNDARKIVTDNKTVARALAELLMEKGVLNASVIHDALNQKSV